MKRTIESSYSKAVAALRPSRSQMQKRHAQANAFANAARDSVRSDIESGLDPDFLYQKETNKERRVILLGYLRRGPEALKHFP